MSVLPDWMIEQQVKIEPLAKQENRPGTISFGTTSYGYDARVGYKFKVFSPIHSTVIDPKAFDLKAMVDVDLTPREMTHDWQARESGGALCKNCGHWMLNPTLSRTKCLPSKPDHILIPPHSFALAETVEYFEIPRSVLAFVVGKSTYARCGIVVPVTPLEPEWKGRVTVEISNTTQLPAKVYCGEGIMQIVFLRTDYSRLIWNDIRQLYKMNGQEPDPEWFDRVLSDEGCRKSYADKQGKYQGQSGLTPPKVD